MSYLKFISITIALGLTILNIFSCQNSDVRRDFLPPQTYIAYSLPYEKYHKIFNRLENKLSRKLQTRGEAHITIITPPEYEKLKLALTADQFKQLTHEFLLSKPLFKEVCIGEGINKAAPEMKTYYIVIQSEQMLQFRQKLSDIAKLPVAQFNPNEFYPHITLGFTDKDLHIQDGVVKSNTSCSKNLHVLLK